MADNGQRSWGGRPLSSDDLPAYLPRPGAPPVAAPRGFMSTPLIKYMPAWDRQLPAEAALTPMPAPRRVVGDNPAIVFGAQQDAAGRAMEPWALPGYLPSEVKGRDTAAQSTKRGAGQLPTVSYAGIPAGGLTIDQALKFLSVTKPRTPVEQAQQGLLDRAAAVRSRADAYLGTLDPKNPNYAATIQQIDQQQRNNLLDVLGGNLFQNYLAGRALGQ